MSKLKNNSSHKAAKAEHHGVKAITQVMFHNPKAIQEGEEVDSQPPPGSMETICQAQEKNESKESSDFQPYVSAHDA